MHSSKRIMHLQQMYRQVSIDEPVMAVDSGELKNWVADIEDKQNHVDLSKENSEWTKRSIYRIPACIKDLNPKAYKPLVVSFGPFHYGEPQVAPMEEHKQRALVHFLARPSNSGRVFEDFVRAVEEDVNDLQAAYLALDEEWRINPARFIKLMILDGCFMLEILRIATGHSCDYAANDPIFSSHGMLYMVPYVKRDMLMIENQLPLLVLNKLLAVETGKPKNDDDINRLVLKFCGLTVWVPTMALGLHPLDMYRKAMIGSSTKTKSVTPPLLQGSNAIIRSSTELSEAGITFKKSRTESLHDIHFRHGVLSLPVIVVDDATEYLYLNLMAFERLHVGAGNEVTSYVFFMDNIIDNPQDVSLLHSKGIIESAIGSDKAVAKLFNTLSKDVVLDPESRLDEIHRKVNKYCQKRLNMWRANLIHTYFRSPWAIISLAAAIFLLLMTVAQTVYTIYPYYKPPHNN